MESGAISRTMMSAGSLAIKPTCKLHSKHSASARRRHPHLTVTTPQQYHCVGSPTDYPETYMTSSVHTRPSGRRNDELRAVKFTRGYTRHAEGSVLVEFGNTRVLCTASVEEGVPGFLRGKNQGWVTAEYGMLPRATHTRSPREATKGKQSGRTQEIQRLIGRSL